MGVNRSAGIKALYMFPRFQNKTQTEKKTIDIIRRNTFISWIFFIPLGQKLNLMCIKKYVKIKIIVMLLVPSKHTKILKFNQYQKFYKT